MRKEEIFEILSDTNFWFKEIETGIKREDYLSLINQKIRTEEILVLSGVRRCGKSTILKQFVKSLKAEKERILIVDFEDYRWKSKKLKLLEEIWNTYLEYMHPKKKPYLFLDEAHSIEGWERFVRTLSERDKSCVIVTGSSSKLLSKEYASLLSGRYIELNIYPLSFKEFLIFENLSFTSEKEIIANRRKILSKLNEYIKVGGFPKYVLTRDIDLLRSYFETIIVKDVAERHEIKRIDKLRNLASFYLSNSGKKITYNSVSKFLEMPLHTVERYSSYLQEAFACFFLPAFSYSLKTQEKLPKKVYSIDTGLSNAVGFRFSEDFGRLMENVVFLELKKAGKEVYYHYDPEIDFVVKEGKKIKELIQVSYASTIEEIKKREMENLLKISKELKCKNLLCITWDFEGEEKIKGKKIKFFPLWKWLLNVK